MSDIAIHVENVSKLYHIGKRQKYKTARESLMNALSLPARLLRGRRDDPDTELWALKDVSFTVPRGEVVGIIGRNGAGKSTLLKVLSRITEPTSGRIALHGRVGSLLEVGTGFHPELTGRENIFLNGAILGMRRGEIQRKFDEIVDFSEISKFLDTPVKFYSSGMYMRLAFAVAAHLEPEILIVDEVLAVGDAAFQKKCLGKMKDVSNSGRTVLFVSHNMNAIAALCTQCVLMSQGRTDEVGPANSVIARHLRSGTGTTAHREWSDPATAPGNASVRLRSVAVRDASDRAVDVLPVTEPTYLDMEYEIFDPQVRVIANLNLTTSDGTCAFAAIDDDPAARSGRMPGRYRSRATIPAHLLAEGEFSVNVALSWFDPLTVHAYEADAVAFRAVDPMDGTSARMEFTGSIPGVVRPKLAWSTSRLEPTKARS